AGGGFEGAGVLGVVDTSGEPEEDVLAGVLLELLAEPELAEPVLLLLEAALPVVLVALPSAGKDVDVAGAVEVAALLAGVLAALEDAPGEGLVLALVLVLELFVDEESSRLVLTPSTAACPDL